MNEVEAAKSTPMSPALGKLASSIAISACWPEPLDRPASDCVYVMWSAHRAQSKIGLSGSPHSRASQLRKRHADDTIRLMSCWSFENAGDFVDARWFEFAMHELLRAKGFGRNGLESLSEWFNLGWPTACEIVEQFAQLWAPLGPRLRRMPGNHGR